MSLVRKETIQNIANSIGITPLSEDVASALASDVEYRMREIMQEAIKCMRHSKRSSLSTDDVNSALSLRNVEPLYGFLCCPSGDPLRFQRVAGHAELFYLEDQELDLKQVVEAPLPKPLLEPVVIPHWLAIEGVQPAIPENTPIPSKKAPESKRKAEKPPLPSGGGGGSEDFPVDTRPAVKHVLSKELQLYFEKISELIVRPETPPQLLADAFQSVATDAGLHALVPYFTQFITDEVMRGLDDLPLLFSLMRLARALLLNPHVHMEPYLHQLMPSVITCLVAKHLGGKNEPGHWDLRDFSATVVAFICRRFGKAYHNLQPRVTKTLLHTWLDPKKARVQHYGAVRGLAALGHRLVLLLILPNLAPYLALLEPEMGRGGQGSQLRAYEASRVYGALLRAAGMAVHDRLKAPPCMALLGGGGRVPRSKWRMAPGARPMKRGGQPQGVVAAPGEGATSSHPEAMQTDPVPLASTSGGSSLLLPKEASASSREGPLPASGVPAGGISETTGQHNSNGGASGGPGAAASSGTPSIVEASPSQGLGPGAVATGVEKGGEGGGKGEDGGDGGGKPSSGAGGSKAPEPVGGKGFSPATVLADAWKEDVDMGQVLRSLFELFGEAVLPFVPHYPLHIGY